ncbi:MAG: polysaccharide deacetylase family protein [Candidatus Saccharicenans sp.]|jgi:peptidoglycan/xylan/chitin deacetylase (PgdA/CDA1 family)|nr:polysaccharide deacetylase family protein [Candidatus Saccharicenans sp.]MDH7575632.1 polysaccharide deacetylase family protein [Candidatus Saccharicenans sp.]
MSGVILKFIELLSKINPLVPYYHVISDEYLPHILHLYPYKNVSNFIKDIEFFCRRFNSIGLDQIIDFVYRGKSLKKNSFIITFDDGYSECFYVIAPILYKKGIPGIFFICSDFIDNKNLCYKNKASLLIALLLKRKKDLITEPIIPKEFSLEAKVKFIQNISYKNRDMLDKIAAINEISWDEYLNNKKPYLTIQQLQEMKRMGFYFGAHSKDHPNFVELSIEEQIEQTRNSVFFIKEVLDLDYSLFAFPFNDRNISLEYFEKAKEFVDISFGTYGILSDVIQWNLQRINFERSLRAAEDIYLRKSIRKALLRMQGKKFIKRK